jgi:hypothetical protein
VNPARAPESFPIGVRADPTITDPGMGASYDYLARRAAGDLWNVRSVSV